MPEDKDVLLGRPGPVTSKTSTRSVSESDPGPAGAGWVGLVLCVLSCAGCAGNAALSGPSEAALELVRLLPSGIANDSRERERDRIVSCLAMLLPGPPPDEFADMKEYLDSNLLWADVLARADQPAGDYFSRAHQPAGGVGEVIVVVVFDFQFNQSPVRVFWLDAGTGALLGSALLDTGWNYHFTDCYTTSYSGSYPGAEVLELVLERGGLQVREWFILDFCITKTSPVLLRSVRGYDGAFAVVENGYSICTIEFERDRKSSDVFGKTYELYDKRLPLFAADSASECVGSLSRIIKVLLQVEKAEGGSVADAVKEHLGRDFERDELLACLFYLDLAVLEIPRTQLAEWLGKMGRYKRAGALSIVDICERHILHDPWVDDDPRVVALMKWAREYAERGGPDSTPSGTSSSE
jgi:hypothetical protein